MADAAFDQAGIDANQNVGGFDLNAPGYYGNNDYQTGLVSGVSLSAQETKTLQQQFPVDPANPQNLFQDPNPQIIRRPAQGGLLTYTQNVKIRFLQPPPVPPPGPLIIKEVRPPQPPPPPPLRIRQQAPPLPQPPPLVLREKPPQPPPAVAAQTVIRQVVALPVPPRSVIIERLPAAPPKPRDIIIERWIPYKTQAKRKTIVQRAEKAKEYPKPRNIIIQYEPVQVRVVRQFQRLGVTPENPQVYVQRYGASLLDTQTLVQKARAAGVVEDISPPNATNVQTSSASLNTEFNSSNSGVETAGSLSTSSVEQASYTGDQQAAASYSALESTQDVGVTSDYSSAYDLSQGAGASEGVSATHNSAVNNGLGGDYASSYEPTQGTGPDGNFSVSHKTNSYSSQGEPLLNGSAPEYGSSTAPAGDDDKNDPVLAAFRAADLDKDGALDANEFRQFLSSQLRL